MRIAWLVVASTASGIGSFWACDQAAEVAATEGAYVGNVVGQGGFMGQGGQGGVGAAPSGGGVSPPTEIAACQGHVYECGDLIDNDSDGLLDSTDPECLGPCDDTEDSLHGGIPGANNAPCRQDCYFDHDSGNNDGCFWSHRCDDNEVAPNYYPEPDRGDQCEHPADESTVNIPGTNQECADLSQEQSDECLANCGPLTPNGCDCFGCCEIPAGSNNFIWLGSVGASGDTVCTLAQVENPALCHPCEVVPGCLNECAECELCAGKTVLPPGCEPGQEQCEPGVEPCGLPGQAPCAGGQVCISGCCQDVPS
jgi:hypothetical protein